MHRLSPIGIVSFTAVLLLGGAVMGVPAPKQSAAGDVVEVEIAGGVKMKFCWIPAGESQLGSPKEEQDYIEKTFFGGNRAPGRIGEWLDSEREEVRGKFETRGFWLGKYVVTQEQWQAMIGKNPSFNVPKNFKKNAGINDTSGFPVDMVTWNRCTEFLKEMNAKARTPAALGKGKFCLPHEDEWEYACRGGKGNKQPFHFGNELNGKQANCDGSKPYGTATEGPHLNRTEAVGSYEKIAPHPWGLCDMHGNVWQLCGNKFDDKKSDFVLRGGPFGSPSWQCRSASRLRLEGPDSASVGLGCRICFRLD